jgi:hypothetical protein
MLTTFICRLHEISRLGLSEQQCKSIRITSDSFPAHLVSKFIIGSIVQPAVVDQFKTGGLNFLYDINRVNAAR